MRAIAAPMRPVPTMPAAAPYRLCPSSPSSEKLLLRTLIYALQMRRFAANASAMACSATASGL